MKTTHAFHLLLGAALIMLAACDSRAPAAPKAAPPPLPNLGLIPIPRDVNAATGSFRIAGDTDVVYSGGEGAAAAARYFVELTKPQVTFAAPKEDTPGSKDIAFVLVADEAKGKAFGAEG